jgi:hypothetical protein
MSLKPAVRFIIAFGILFGLLYGFLMPEKFTSYKAQTVLVNGATHPMSDSEIEKALGVNQYLPSADEDEDEDEDENSM